MNPRFPRRRFTFLFASLLAALAIAIGLVDPNSRALAAPQENSGAKAVVTDQAKLAVSNNYSVPPSQLALASNGEVLFLSGGGAFSSALFRWTGGAPARVLQASDPMRGFSDRTLSQILAFDVKDDGDASLMLGWLEKDIDSPNGIFVLQGSSLDEVAIKGNPAPGTGKQFNNFGGTTFINAANQVAFSANFGPLALNDQGIYVGAVNTTPVKVAVTGETAPGGSEFDTFALRGLADDGDVVFAANGPPGSFPIGLFYWDWATSTTSLIASPGTAAPGTGGGTFRNLNTNQLFSNAVGQVAFFANVTGSTANSGIWVYASGVLSPLILNTDGTPFGGTYGGGITIRGINDNGKVLFNSNVAGAAPKDHALFVKDLGSPAEVVFYRTQPEPSGSGTVLFQTAQAAINNSDAVAFQAFLDGPSAPSPSGWFLWSGPGAPSKIALQGEPMLGGTLGFAGRTTSQFALQRNGGNRVVFAADILGPGTNITAVLSWTTLTGFTAVVKSIDPLPAGANLLVRGRGPGGPVGGASNDELLFTALRAGGQSTTYAIRLGNPVKIRRVVGEGDPAPGGGTIANFALGQISINDSETVSILATAVLGTATYPESAVYISKPGQPLQRLVGSGDGTPAGGNYVSVVNPRLNNNDQVVFFGNLIGGSGRQGVFLFDPMTMTAERVAVLNDASPVVGSNFQNFPGGGRFAINDSGLVVFDANVGPTPNPVSYGLFAWSSGNPIEKIVLQGDTVFDGSSPYTFLSASLPTTFRINSSGELAYDGQTAEGTDGIHFWRGPGTGVPDILVHTGTPAPGTIGATFSSTTSPEINNAGNLAFGATLSWPTGDETAGYFFYDGVNVLPRLLEGDPLPDGGVAEAASAPLALSESGEVAMGVRDVATAGTFDTYVIADPTGVLRLFARVNDSAPGTGSDFGTIFRIVTTNSTGQFFLSAGLIGNKTKSGVFVNRQ